MKEHEKIFVCKGHICNFRYLFASQYESENLYVNGIKKKKENGERYLERLQDYNKWTQSVCVTRLCFVLLIFVRNYHKKHCFV